MKNATMNTHRIKSESLITQGRQTASEEDRQGANKFYQSMKKKKAKKRLLSQKKRCSRRRKEKERIEKKKIMLKEKFVDAEET